MSALDRTSGRDATAEEEEGAERSGDVLPRWRRESEETVSLGRLPVSAALCPACRPRVLRSGALAWPGASESERAPRPRTVSAGAGSSTPAVGTRRSASWEGRAAEAEEDCLGLSPSSAAGPAASRQGVCPPPGSDGTFDYTGSGRGRSRPLALA